MAKSGRHSQDIHKTFVRLSWFTLFRIMSVSIRGSIIIISNNLCCPVCTRNPPISTPRKKNKSTHDRLDRTCFPSPCLQRPCLWSGCRSFPCYPWMHLKGRDPGSYSTLSTAPVELVGSCNWLASLNLSLFRYLRCSPVGGGPPS